MAPAFSLTRTTRPKGLHSCRMSASVASGGRFRTCSTCRQGTVWCQPSCRAWAAGGRPAAAVAVEGRLPKPGRCGPAYLARWLVRPKIISVHTHLAKLPTASQRTVQRLVIWTVVQLSLGVACMPQAVMLTTFTTSLHSKLGQSSMHPQLVKPPQHTRHRVHSSKHSDKGQTRAIHKRRMDQSPRNVQKLFEVQLSPSLWLVCTTASPHDAKESKRSLATITSHFESFKKSLVASLCGSAAAVQWGWKSLAAATVLGRICPWHRQPNQSTPVILSHKYGHGGDACRGCHAWPGPDGSRRGAGGGPSTHFNSAGNNTCPTVPAARNSVAVFSAKPASACNRTV